MLETGGGAGMVNVLPRLGQPCPVKNCPWHSIHRTLTQKHCSEVAWLLCNRAGLIPTPSESRIFMSLSTLKASQKIPTSLGVLTEVQLNSEWLFLRLCHYCCTHQSSGVAHSRGISLSEISVAQPTSTLFLPFLYQRPVQVETESAIFGRDQRGCSTQSL